MKGFLNKVKKGVTGGGSEEAAAEPRADVSIPTKRERRYNISINRVS